MPDSKPPSTPDQDDPRPDGLLSLLHDLRPKQVRTALNLYRKMRHDPALEPEGFDAVLNLIVSDYDNICIDKLDEACEIKSLTCLASPDGKRRPEKLPSLLRFYEQIYDLDSLEPIGGAIEVLGSLVGPADEVLRLIFRTVEERDEDFNRDAWQRPAMDIVNTLPDRGVNACAAYAEENNCWFRLQAVCWRRNPENGDRFSVDVGYWRYEPDQPAGQSFLERVQAKRGLTGLKELLDSLALETAYTSFEAAIGPGGIVRIIC